MAIRRHARRRRIYLILTAIAVLVMAGLDSLGSGSTGWAAAAVAIILLAVAIAIPDQLSPFQPLAAMASSAIAVAMIVSPLLLREKAGDLLSLATVWPEVIVTLFAGMALDADRALRFAVSWSDPRRLRAPASLLSLGAGLSIGIAVSLFFYALIDAFSGSDTPHTATGFLVSAIKGSTPVHRILILLFFTTLALLAFAALISARERRALEAFRKRLAELDDHLTAPDSEAAKAPFLAPTFERFADCRVTAMARFKLAVADAAPIESFRALTQEQRRFIRALISFMPILGFIGTVIGLATAISALQGVAAGPEGNSAIAASLSGLAVKFETTLLGLGGALLASVILALLDRHDTEIQIDAERLFTAATTRHAD